MKRVFADAYFYLAVLNRTDAAHAQAMAAVEDGSVETVTTAAVLLEVADAMAIPSMRVACAQFLERLIERSPTTVHTLSDDLLTSGMMRYRQRPDKAWSLTDCISFIVMEGEGLREALTGDRHFEQAGFIALLK
jgi:predicted nucleic acid-binding protein